MDGPVKATAGRQTASRAKGHAAAAAKGRRASLRRPYPGSSPERALHIDLGGLDELTGYVVRRAQVWIFQDFKRALKDLEMTPAQFAVMKIVAANAGIVQARVAEVLSIERARLVEMLDRLEARQLITRSRSATDRRSHALEVTRDGMALLDSLRPLIAEHEQNVLSRIGARDKAELLRILAPLLR
jgi:DNA-binding MarR family transcriptional regulator